MIDKELKNKIIIRNYTNKDDLEIMQYIKTVIYEGKNSIVNGKKQYFR